MDDILHLTAHGNLPGRPIAHRRGGSIWLFAGANFQPSFWLLRYRQHFGRTSALALSGRLSGAMRRELIRRYDAAGLYEHGRSLPTDIGRVQHLLLRTRIQAYELPAVEYLHRLNDPEDYLLAPAQHGPPPSLALAPTQALQAARYAVADELGGVLAARWEAKDGADNGYWGLSSGGRTLVSGATLLIAQQQAVQGAIDSLPSLASLGSLADLVGSVADAAVDAALFKQRLLQRLRRLSRQDLEAMLAEVGRLRVAVADTVEAVAELAARGLEIYNTLIGDAPTRRMLTDFLSSYVSARSHLTRLRTWAGVSAAIGVEVLIALAATALTKGAAAVAVAARASQRIGQFSGRAIQLLAELYEKLKAFNRNKVVTVAPEPVRIQPATTPGSTGGRATAGQSPGDPSHSAARVPDQVVRSDDDFSARANRKGQGKSYLDEEGNLIPANPGGNVTVQQHVRGSDPAKSNSQYTSVVGPGAGTPKRYGAQQIEVDTKRLQQDIDTGRVTGVEIVPNSEVQRQLQVNVDQARARYDANPTMKNQGRLDAAVRDYDNAMRDNECLISGCVPSRYISGPH